MRARRLETDFHQLLHALYPPSSGNSKKKLNNRLFSEQNRMDGDRGSVATVISMSLELQTTIVEDAKQYLLQKPNERAEYDDYLDYLTMKHKVSKKDIRELLWNNPNFFRPNAWSLKYYPCARASLGTVMRERSQKSV